MTDKKTSRGSGIKKHGQGRSVDMSTARSLEGCQITRLATGTPGAVEVNPDYPGMGTVAGESILDHHDGVIDDDLLDILEGLDA